MTNDLKAQLESLVSDVFASDQVAHRAIARVKRRRRFGAGAIALAVIGMVVGVTVLISGTSDSQGRPATLVPTGSPSPAAPSLAPPTLGAQQITPLTSPVEVTGTGTQTVELGPAPARANGIDMQLVCLSAGTFTVTPGGTSITCSTSDVGNPRGSSITYPYAMSLAHGQHSLTVTTAAGVGWRLTARYAIVSDTPWGVNASGQTYGTENDRGVPDLVLVVFAKGGKTGYVYSSESGPTSCPQPSNPTQALEWQNTPLVTVHVPVYLSDGKTRIGQLDEQTNEAYVQAAAQCPQPHLTPSSN